MIDKYVLQCALHMRDMSFWQLSPPLSSLIFTGSTGKPCDGAAGGGGGDEDDG